MGLLGVLTLKALDSKDVFLREMLYLDGILDINEFPCDVLADPGFEYGAAYLTGLVPQAIPVDVDGDSGIIMGWLTTANIPFNQPFSVKIYLLCEELDAEEELKEISNDGSADTTTDTGEDQAAQV